MKVFWDGHDAQAWDQAHGRSAGALQQDWAYGETMMALGVACLRARVERDGQAVALAQFSCKRYIAMLVVVGGTKMVPQRNFSSF